ncbi:MAG: NAD(P)H-dependent oxidoreductase [Proteobacteria bacterium]|nr:NAD(P)H-dependent oxidoreductase [Pseudomonadota bacterium]
MINILGISGSLRKKSFNTALLRAAAGMMPEGAALTVKTLHGISLYDGDDEAANGVPQSVIDFQKGIAEADALLIATPEYNNSIPGVLKNAMDWASRPSARYEDVFDGKPVAVIGASPGGFGTVLAQDAWLPVLKLLGTRPWFGGRLMVSRAHTVFNDAGEITDQNTRDFLQSFLHGFTGDLSKKG